MDLNLLLHYGSLFPARVAQLLLEIDMAVYPPSILFSTTHDCAWSGTLQAGPRTLDRRLWVCYFRRV